MITTRSKVSIFWTTNPADLVGYDGVPTSGHLQGAWKTGTPAIVTSPRKAIQFREELNKKVGHGTYKAIAYFVRGKQVSISELREIVSDSEYKKMQSNC